MNMTHTTPCTSAERPSRTPVRLDAPRLNAYSRQVRHDEPPAAAGPSSRDSAPGTARPQTRAARAAARRTGRGVHAATPPPFAFPLLLVVLATLGGVGGVVFNAVAPPNWRIIASSPAEGVDALRSAAQDASSRGYRRSAVQAGPAAIRPVAGLNPKQMAHAVLIVQVGQEMDLSDRAMVIAMITAMQETDLRNFASSRLPHSL